MKENKPVIGFIKNYFYQLFITIGSHPEIIFQLCFPHFQIFENNSINFIEI